MLDVGTGSGILAIAARKLGAEYIVGVDTDSVTIRVARENARLNLTKIALSKRGIEDIHGRFSMVVANIITEELVKIAPTLVKRISPDGFLILSGILRERVAEVKKAYRAFFQKTYRTFRYGEWVCLVYRASYEKIFS
jgi:ribosomal protein L11 methyltransferase